MNDHLRSDTFVPRHPRDEDRAEIRKALLATFPDNDPKDLEDYGDGLVAVAEALDIPMECLRFWIHDGGKGKDYSQHAWRVWCARYVSARDKLPPEVAAILPASPEGAELAHYTLCVHCYASVVQQIDGYWWCQRCGVVQV